MAQITKAVIPAAGMGTRFLPATKALPKEMLPIVDKPVIQYVMEEAVEAGLSHVLMITGRHKAALENHFDKAAELEQVLESRGDGKKLKAISQPNGLADLHYVRQGDPKGLGHAISKAKTFIGNEAFAVLLGDDVIVSDSNLLQKMLTLAEVENANVVALMEVPREEVSKYGVILPGRNNQDIIEVKAMMEKPSMEEAPSQLVSIGRYVLQPAVFDVLERLEPGVGGEIQLTDALNLMARNPGLAGPVLGIVLNGRRYDTGDRVSYLKTIVEFAVQREDIGEEFTSWLRRFSTKL